MGVWQGDVSLSFQIDLEGVGRQRIFDIPAKPGEPGLLRSPVWFAAVGVVGEAGVETIMMAGRRGDRRRLDNRHCWRLHG